MSSTELNYKKLKKTVTIIAWMIFGFVLLVEVADNIMLYVTRSQGYGPDTVVHKFLRYLVLTSTINLLCVAIPQIIIKIGKIADRRACSIILAGISFISINVVYSHYQFTIAFAVLILPVLVSIMYENKRVSLFTIVVAVLGTILAGICRGLDPVYKVDVIPELVIAFTILISYSIFATMIVGTMNKSRNDLAEALVMAEKAKLIDAINDTNNALEQERDKLRSLSEETFNALSNAVDFNDHYTNGHSKRVAMYSSEIAKRMGFNAEQQREIYYAGLLHDVGKIGIDNDIINKNGRLTDEEFEQIKMHPSMGYQILKSISLQGNFAIGAKWHHERYDGKGYPDGLVGNEIPEICRIIAIADSYDAMTSKRSYRNTMSQEKVREQIEQGKGTQFDPDIADIMLQLIDEDTEYTMRQDTDRKSNIVIIDDDITCIEQMRGILKNENCNVIGATNFTNGLKIINTITVDLVFLDALMPDVDGFEAYRKIRSEGLNVPIAFISGDNNIETIKRAKSLGIVDYFVKPVNASAIREVIQSTLS